MVAAQYDDPPKYPVTVICGGIDRASANDTLGKIFAGLVAYEGIKSCYVNDDQPVSDDDYETAQGWSWQVINCIQFNYLSYMSIFLINHEKTILP